MGPIKRGNLVKAKYIKRPKVLRYYQMREGKGPSGSCYGYPTLDPQSAEWRPRPAQGFILVIILKGMGSYGRI